MATQDFQDRHYEQMREAGLLPPPTQPLGSEVQYSHNINREAYYAEHGTVGAVPSSAPAPKEQGRNTDAKPVQLNFGREQKYL